MIRAVLRFLGLLSLAAGFIFLVYDGARSIVDSGLRLYKISQAWSDVHQASLTALQPLLERRLGAWAWDPVAVMVLQQPIWLVFGLLGIVLLLLGRRKKPLIGYARG